MLVLFKLVNSTFIFGEAEYSELEHLQNFGGHLLKL